MEFKLYSSKNTIINELNDQLMHFCFLFILFLTFSCSNTNVDDAKPSAKMVLISTQHGDIKVHLDDRTPEHQSSFIELVEDGFFDSLTINRVIDGFVIQGGCPDTEDGFSDSPHLIDPEFHDSLGHVYGAFGAGRDDNPEKRSAICQFYIVQNKNGIARLDGNYTIFGQVIQGMDVVEHIAKLDTDSIDQPVEAVRMTVKTIK